MICCMVIIVTHWNIYIHIYRLPLSKIIKKTAMYDINNISLLLLSSKEHITSQRESYKI